MVNIQDTELQDGMQIKQKEEYKFKNEVTYDLSAPCNNQRQKHTN